MKRLILTRHAKSSWDDPATPDHDRPLNERGKAAAAELGTWLASRGYVPAEVLCSDALRTRGTWSGLAPALPDTPILHLKPALYHAGPDVMLAVVIILIFFVQAIQSLGDWAVRKLVNVWRATNTIPVDEEGAKDVFDLIEALEDSDDVQAVHSNFDVPEDVMQRLSAA